MLNLFGRSVSGTLAALLVVAFAATACSGSGDDKAAEKKKKQTDREPAKVNLPEPPPASALEVEELHSDGSFRVEGLIATQGKHLGDDVEVKGKVAYVSPDCDPRRAQKKGEECPKPYLTIEDKEEGEAEMMVVGFERDFLDRAEVEKGETYLFKGKYKKLAQGFVASESGLILLNEVNGESVLEDSGG